MTPEGTLLQPSRTQVLLRRLFCTGRRFSAAAAYVTPLRRHIDAGGRISYVISSETPVLALFLLRREQLVRNPVGNPRSGVISTPEGSSRTGLRMKPLLWRHFLAGGRILAASLTITVPSAPAAPAATSRSVSQVHLSVDLLEKDVAIAAELGLANAGDLEQLLLV